MKLIQRTVLHYQEGSSDKIYEVDLCEVGSSSYVVNFRYGRRGGKLKEGVETDTALPLAQAQKVFDKLVASKVKKGYRDVSSEVGSANPAPEVEVAVNIPISGDKRKDTILKRLASNKNDKKWPLERAIWRAGELKISEATPILLQLLGSGNELRDYCIVWALGWCGGNEAIPTIYRIYQNNSTPDFIKRIAYEALLKLSDEENKARLKSEKIESLPEDLKLKLIARNGSAESFANALRIYIDSDDYRKLAILDTIYQIDNQYVRPALLEVLRTAPFKPNYFQRIRHIFKIAEYRQDAEVFGILAYRFEREPAMYKSNPYSAYLPTVGYIRKYEYRYNNVTHRYDRSDSSEFKDEMQRPDTRFSYSSDTCEYFERRIWRTLKGLGEEGDRNYINMAVSVLLQYSDNDAKSPKHSSYSQWKRSLRKYVTYTRDWDTFANCIILYHIIYENSPRYVFIPHSKAWRCQESYKPGDPEPQIREEAFPQLWEQQPQALLKLLLESNCRPVHQFAAKALRACESFYNQIDIDTIIKLVNKPYEVTAQLGFELARELYNPANPNLELVLAITNCLYQPARDRAYQWIDAQREYFLASSNFIAALVTSKQADTRAFARRFLSSSILSDTTAKVLIGRIIGELLSLGNTPPQPPLIKGRLEEIKELAKEIGEILLISFTFQLRTLGMGVILDLLRHPLPEVQEIGARILLNHETRAVDLPPELIESLLASPYESIRAIGVRIFGQLPDERLISDRILIVTMAANPVAEIRNAIRPVIRRLTTNNIEFGSQIASDFIDILITAEKQEGIHSDLVRLLREDIPRWMHGISRKTAMRLLQAKSSVAQELGGVVLKENCDRWLNEFEISEIVKLANHEILAIREAAREMFTQRLERIRTDSQEMLAAVRILESKWQDSREFAHRIFSSLNNEEWTPEVMVAICDSIRDDVRQFGRNLVTQTFQENYGQDYLLKFSEHPSSDMQLFATNYLESYAANNPARLQELIPYFVSVLSRVNKGGVAKKRIFAFLDSEADKSEEAAKVVAEIMTRQSATIAINDKAKAIQTMLKIRQKYPQVSLPIQVKDVREIKPQMYADKRR